MKKIVIPLIEKELNVFTGKDEWNKFAKLAEKLGCINVDPECPNEMSGRAYGSAVWVGNVWDKSLVYHEVHHFLDDCFTYVNCDEEGEFKAYIAGHVLGEVHKWIEKCEKEKEKEKK